MRYPKPIREILTEAVLLEIMRKRPTTWDLTMLTRQLQTREEVWLPLKSRGLVREAMLRLVAAGAVRQVTQRPARWVQDVQNGLRRDSGS